MNKKKVIVYLHGFGSSGQSGTVKHLRKIFPMYGVFAPDKHKDFSWWTSYEQQDP